MDQEKRICKNCSQCEKCAIWVNEGDFGTCKNWSPKYSGRGGYHGGGRKKTGVKRQGCHFSATPEQLEQLKNQAKAEGLNLSTYILKLAGIK